MLAALAVPNWRIAQRRPRAPLSPVSELGPDLDTFGRGDAAFHVRYASNSDRGDELQQNVEMCQSRLNAPQQNVSLFDHLVGEGEHFIGDRKAKRFRGLEVDHQLELGRLQTGRSAGFSPLRMRPT